MFWANPVPMSEPAGHFASEPACVILAALHALKRAPFVAMPSSLMVSFSIESGRLPSVSRTLKPSAADTGTGLAFVPFDVGLVEAVVVYTFAAMAALAGTSSIRAREVRRIFLVIAKKDPAP